MEYLIVADSSCELNEELKKNDRIKLVNFKIYVEEEEHEYKGRFFEVSEFIRKMRKSSSPVRTACPSPGEFSDAYGDGENIFVITISSNLSGAYNSALLATEITKSKNPNVNIHVFDSLAASCAESLIALKILECIEKKYEFAKIVEVVEEYISNMTTMFVLKSLDNLVNNGRISKVAGMIGTAFHITPILEADGGIIKLVESIRGRKKSLNRLLEIIESAPLKIDHAKVAVSHCNAYETAEKVVEKLTQMEKFSEVLLFETGDLSSTYADDGGIIICF